MLSFFLAFYYADREYFDKERILCLSDLLLTIQNKHRLKQKGILKRFPINCYGTQETREDMRAEKARKYKELRKKPNSKEFEEWFLRYVPNEKYKFKTKTSKNRKYRTVLKKRTNKKTRTNKANLSNSKTKSL